MASPSLLLLQSQISVQQMSEALSQSSQEVEEDQNFLSVSTAAETASAEDNLSTKLSSSSRTSKSITTTSITETFGSSMRMEDSYQPHTSILGSTGLEQTDYWRKSSADTTHDVSDLELDSEITDLALQEHQRRQARKQCTLL